jgi:hypothetical protein
MPLLQKALKQRKCTPQRDPAKWAEPLRAEAVPAVVVVDGTERRRQRPQKAQTQKEHYSGKKNTYPQESVDDPTPEA